MFLNPDTIKMGPEGPYHHVIKIGKLHSPSNLSERAKYFEEHYGDCIIGAEFPNRFEEDSAIKPSSYYERYPDKGFKGFLFNTNFLKPFFMNLDIIAELEMHEDFSSDDESFDDTKKLQKFSAIPLSLNFDFERGLTFKGQRVDINDDESFSDDEDSISQRPVSRLSLEVDEKFDDLTSEYDSDYFFCESEGEGDDNPKKVIYGPVPGIAVGAVWRTRRQCSRSFVHVPCKSRIHSGVKAGCSLVLSSREMVVDDGIHFKYKSKAKLGKSHGIMTDDLIGGNKVLHNNLMNRIPLRVIRSYQMKNRFAPKKGYRYDGLYDVTAIYDDIIKNGNQYCEVNFHRCPNQAPPPWATNSCPAGDIPGHLLSTIEIDYITSDDLESESDNRESPVPLLVTPVYLLDPKLRCRTTVDIKRLTTTEIERATNRICAPKEPVRTIPRRRKGPPKQNKNSVERSKKPGKSKQLVSEKHSGSSKTATKAVQGSGTKSYSANDKSSNNLKEHISKNQDIQTKRANISVNSSSLKQNIGTWSSFSQKGSLQGEMNVTPQAKNMAIKSVERTAVKRKKNTEGKQEKAVSTKKKQTLTQTKEPH